MKGNNLISAGATISAGLPLRKEVENFYRYRKFGVVKRRGQISIFGKKADIIRTMDDFLATIYQIACPIKN